MSALKAKLHEMIDALDERQLEAARLVLERMTPPANDDATKTALRGRYAALIKLAGTMKEDIDGLVWQKQIRSEWD